MNKPTEAATAKVQKKTKKKTGLSYLSQAGKWRKPTADLTFGIKTIVKNMGNYTYPPK